MKFINIYILVIIFFGTLNGSEALDSSSFDELSQSFMSDAPVDHKASISFSIQSMDLTEKMHTLIDAANNFNIYNSQPSYNHEERQKALITLQTTLHSDPENIFKIIGSDLFNKIINYERTTIDSNDINELKKKLYESYPTTICRDLEILVNIPKIDDTAKESLKNLLPYLIKHHGKQSLTITKLLNPLTLAQPIATTSLQEINLFVLDLCFDNKSFDNQVKKIYSHPILTVKQKRKSLSDLYQKFLNTKPTGPTETGMGRTEYSYTMRDWLIIDSSFKRVYKRLKDMPEEPQIEKANEAITTSMHEFQENFSDLNRSIILDPEIKYEEKYQKFQRAYDYLQQNLSSSKKINNDLKKELINNLEIMSTFIYENDLNPKEKDKLHESERCWLLSLIKNALEHSTLFSETILKDWLEQIRHVKIVTDKSLKNKAEGGDIQSSKLQLDELAKIASAKKINKQKTIISLQKRSVEQNQKKKSLHSLLTEQEKNIKKNIYNTTLLSEYLSNLKKYRKLLISSEEQEIKKIDKLIKTTAHKIKRLVVIAPRKKTWQEKFQTFILKSSIDQRAINSKILKDLETVVRNIESRLPLELYYDSTQVLDPNDLLCQTTISVLNKYLVAFNEKARLTDITQMIDSSHFKQLAIKIEELQSLLNMDKNKDNQDIKNMIASYQSRIQSDINLFIKQITDGLWISKNISLEAKKKIIEQYFNQNNMILKPYYDQVIKTIQLLPPLPSSETPITIKSIVSKPNQEVPIQKSLQAIKDKVNLIPMDRATEQQKQSLNITIQNLQNIQNSATATIDEKSEARNYTKTLVQHRDKIDSENDLNAIKRTIRPDVFESVTKQANEQGINFLLNPKQYVNFPDDTSLASLFQLLEFIGHSSTLVLKSTYNDMLMQSITESIIPDKIELAEQRIKETISTISQAIAQEKQKQNISQYEPTIKPQEIPEPVIMPDPELIKETEENIQKKKEEDLNQLPEDVEKARKRSALQEIGTIQLNKRLENASSPSQPTPPSNPIYRIMEYIGSWFSKMSNIWNSISSWWRSTPKQPVSQTAAEIEEPGFQ